MYQIKYGQVYLYDPRDSDLCIRDPEVHLGVGEPGNVDFTMDTDHPYVGKLSKMKGTVEVLQDANPIYRGRIVRTEQGFENSRRIETEGILACLNDSVISPFEFPDDFSDDEEYQAAASGGNVVEFLLGWLLKQHNNQVDSDRQIKIGVVTVTDPNNYIAREASDYSTTWDAIKNKLSGSSLGGYLLPRYEDDGTYLDYLSDLPLTNMQPIEFGINLLDVTNAVNAADVYSGILPLGVDGLTIENLPDGEISPDVVKEGKLLYSIKGRAEYGKITKVIKWDDVTIDTNLQSKAVDLLESSGVLMSNSITIKACDLHCDSGTIASFRVGRYIIIKSAPHGLNRSFALLALEPDILDPGNTRITVGATAKTQSDINQENRVAAEERFERYKTETDHKLGELVDSTSQQITEAVQTAQGIIFKALEGYVQTGDFETYQQTVSSSLSILSDSINLSIQSVTTQISDLNGDLQQQISDITKYFRFSEEGLLIGETGNEVLLRLDNDVIQFLRNNMPGLWMDEDGLHAESVSISRLQIGKAELTMEGERLTLRKVASD